MAVAWDQRSHAEQRRRQNSLLRQTVLQMALAHIPTVRNRLASAGLDARLFRGLDELDQIPLSMRRDVFDETRNPEGPRGVLLRGTEEGVKRFSDTQTWRKILLARLIGGEDVQERAIEAANRAIHIHLAEGPGGRIPVAYTRDDLDLLARAGARLGAVVGLAREDRLLNLVPFGARLDFWGIFYMAHGMGMSAVHARRARGDIQAALDTFDETGTTAIAVPADEALAFVDAAAASSLDIERLRVLLAVGRSLTADERGRIGTSLVAAGAHSARIAAVYGPREGHVLWGECAVPAGHDQTFGFHTYPDLGVVEVISPETTEPVGEREPAEIVVTPLVFRGSGVPRWRTGDLALGGLTTEPCPNCGRTVPRIGPTVLQGAWQRRVVLNGTERVVDLRDAGAAAAERARDWQVELDSVNGGNLLYVHLVATDDPGPLIELYEDLKRSGSEPSQVILTTEGELARRWEQAPGPWHRYWVRGERGVVPLNGSPSPVAALEGPGTNRD